MLCLVRVVFLFILFISIGYCQICPMNVSIPFSQYSPQISFKAGLFCSFYENNLVLTVKVCCDGYYMSNTKCIPKNGRCETPNECSCNEGFTMVNERCVPECHDCDNGNCIAPNQCICKSGYVKNKNGQCDPKCKDGCVNGICNEQNQCVCRDGYHFNKKLLDFGIKKNTVCTPKCDQPCSNGECFGRNQCKCNSGYEKLVNTSTCMPTCNPKLINCTHGNCVGPNMCECHEGYKIVKNNCMPECETAFIEGNCFVPGKCNFSQGYQKTNDSNDCEPLSDSPCENGISVGINESRFLNNRCILEQNISCFIILIVAGVAFVVFFVVRMFKCFRKDKDHPAPEVYFAKDNPSYWLDPSYDTNPDHSKPCDAQSTINTMDQKDTADNDQIYDTVALTTFD